MTDLQQQIDENADSLEMLLLVIKNLEERIFALEAQMKWNETQRLVQDGDAYYWHNG